LDREESAREKEGKNRKQNRERDAKQTGIIDGKT
jgi:hypothetical protein